MIRILKTDCGDEIMFLNANEIRDIRTLFDFIFPSANKKHPFVNEFYEVFYSIERRLYDRPSAEVGVIYKSYCSEFRCKVPIWGVTLNRDEFSDFVMSYTDDLSVLTFDEILG